MSLRRVLAVLSVSLVSLGTYVVAGPAAAAPGTDPAPPATGSAAGSGAGSAAAGSGAGSAVDMTEDAPPADMNGTDENPEAPHAVGMEPHVTVAAPAPKRPAGYPIEEALRPITLPQNMSEVSIDPHAWLSYSPVLGAPVSYAGATALRARYGITSKVQLGLTYLIGGIYDDPATGMKKDYGFHAGRAFGLDVTVMLKKWIGVKVGVPFYVNPVALSLAVGVPMKFNFGDKFAIGGLDDLLNIRLDRFAPSFYQEVYNAVGAQNDTNGTEQSRGHLRVSAYGIYQYRPKLAILGRIGVDNDLGLSSGGPAGTSSGGGTTMFLRAAVHYTLRKFLDVGGSLGFDDLGHAGSFGPAAYLAVRI